MCVCVCRPLQLPHFYICYFILFCPVPLSRVIFNHKINYMSRSRLDGVYSKSYENMKAETATVRPAVRSGRFRNRTVTISAIVEARRPTAAKAAYGASSMRYVSVYQLVQTRKLPFDDRH